jgi:hypothetical protein
MKHAAMHRALGVLGATLGLLVVLSCPAFAGSYVVTACSPSNSAGAWAQTNSYPAGLATANLCGGAAIGPLDGGDRGALSAQDILNTPADIPDGARAGWTFSAPPGATITAISYYRNLSAHDEPDVVAGLFDGGGAALEQCKIPWPFVAGSSIDCSRPNNQAPVTFTGLNTSSLFFGVLCHIVDNATACIDGGTIHAARADLYSANVTLAESTAPALSSVAGALWGGGVIFGVAPVTFAAADASGIQAQVVRSDTGQTLSSATQPCDFRLASPCAQQPHGSLSVDTTRVPDGPHTFSLLVSDAATNSQVATSPAVLVDNSGPPPPMAFAATAKDARSTNIALSWRSPPSAPAPVSAAMLQLCRSTCAAPVTITTSGSAQIHAPKAGTYSLRLWLLDVYGRGGPHNAALAKVTVPQASTSASSLHTKLTAVITGRRLRVSATLQTSGRVKVSWRSKSRGRTVASGSRIVSVHQHKIAATFMLSRRARSARTHVAIRAGRRILAHTRARRA